MTPEVHTVAPGTPVSTVRELMYRRSLRHVPVVTEDGELIGLITHEDLLRQGLIERSDVPPMVEQEVLDQTTAEAVMRTLVDTTQPDADLSEAAQLMLDNKCSCLPVVEQDRLVGVLTEADFVRCLSERT